MKKFWFEEMLRLSVVVGAGLCAGWYAGGAVLPHAAVADVAPPALIFSRAELAPKQIFVAVREASAPVAEQNASGSRPGACSLDPRDYADEAPIGAPAAPGHKKKHGVACG